MELTKLLETKAPDLTLWTEFKGFEIKTEFKGFEIKLPYIDKPALEAMVGRAKSRTWNRKHQMTETVDEKKLVRGLAGLIIDWRLTLGRLAELLPFDITGEDADAPVTFTAENAAVLVAQVYGLDDFIIETVTDLQRFRALALDNEAKN